MRLTSYTDYALRVLLYVGAAEHAVTITTVSNAFGISKDHLRKVVHALSQHGYLHTTQGRSGGLTLGMPANRINLRDVVMQFEPGEMVECFSKDANTCPITAMCGLKHALMKAQRKFFETLGEYYLSDLISNPRLVIFVKQSSDAGVEV